VPLFAVDRSNTAAESGLPATGRTYALMTGSGPYTQGLTVLSELIADLDVRQKSPYEINFHAFLNQQFLTQDVRKSLFVGRLEVDLAVIFRLAGVSE
jgi:hypothetical protein